MKKLVFVSILALLLLSALVGCGDNGHAQYLLSVEQLSALYRL